MTLRGVFVVQRDLGHQRVEGDGSGVVGHHQRPALGRHVADAAHLHPKPLAVQRS
jgi:hypothetical protein